MNQFILKKKSNNQENQNCKFISKLSIIDDKLSSTDMQKNIQFFSFDNVNMEHFSNCWDFDKYSKLSTLIKKGIVEKDTSHVGTSFGREPNFDRKE